MDSFIKIWSLSVISKDVKKIGVLMELRKDIAQYLYFFRI